MYLQLPNNQKFDSRVERKALEIANKNLANIPSGNTGFKVKYGSFMQTLCSGYKYLKRISKFKKRDESLQRTWLEYKDLLQKEYREEVLKLTEDKHINQLDFLDLDKISKYINNWSSGKDKVSSHFLMLMLTFKSFMDQLEE